MTHIISSFSFFFFGGGVGGGGGGGVTDANYSCQPLMIKPDKISRDIPGFGCLSHTVRINNNNNNIYHLYCAFSIKYSKAHHNSK